jgi:putative addiction module component (TIGR02574 family)
MVVFICKIKIDMYAFNQRVLGGSLMKTLIEIVHAIEKLQPIERVRIVEMVMRDIIQPDSDIDKVWAQEASKRWNAYKRGEVKPIPYDEVMSKYKKS